MTRFRGRPNLRVVLCLLAVTAVKATGQATPPPYVGSETCLTCHEDIYNAFARNPHHQVDTDSKRGWKGQACESCHGPAQKHTESASAEDIRNPPNSQRRPRTKSV